MRYAVFFRGLNVGGKNRVAMGDLRQLLLDLGFAGVRTYIQSGNAVLESGLDEAALLSAIRPGFADRFGFDGGAVLRSADEMRALTERLPFPPEEIAAAEEAGPGVEHLYVHFLPGPPERERLDAVLRAGDGQDLLSAGERELYLLCRRSIRDSRLAQRAAREFGSATVRNWKTVCRMCQLLDGR